MARRLELLTDFPSSLMSLLDSVTLGSLVTRLCSSTGGSRGRAQGVMGSHGTNMDLGLDPVPRLIDVVSDLSEDGLSRRCGAVLEVGVLLAGIRAELIEGTTLGDGLQNRLVMPLAHGPWGL
jgi:hypothetical protein